jgi:hypothetical protein
MTVYNPCILVFFTTFQCHNASTYNYEEKALIICLMTNCKLTKTPAKAGLNAKVASWTKSNWNVSSILPSMILEDNVGEDGLFSQSTYTLYINDKNYIDLLSPHPALFRSKVPIENDILKKVYSQLIIALNDVRVQKSMESSLSAIWNGKSVDTYIAQVKAKDVVIDSDDIEFYDWSIHNSQGHCWSCDNIEQCPILKLAIEKATKKSPHYDLAGNLFHLDHGIVAHHLLDSSHLIPSPTY